MIAYRLLAAQQPPYFQEVPKPSPGPGQLLIKVGGCGLFHTDLGTARIRTKEEWSDRRPPFTTGHEIAGWVTESGQKNGSADGLRSSTSCCSCRRRRSPGRSECAVAQ